MKTKQIERLESIIQEYETECAEKDTRLFEYEHLAHQIILPTKKKKHYVQFFYPGEGDQPFICGVDGHFTADMLDEIEKDFLSEGFDAFNKGAGDYLFQVSYNSEQRGEFGMIEIPAWWELTEVLFEPVNKNPLHPGDRGE